MQTMLGMGVSPSKIVYANPCKQASHIRLVKKLRTEVSSFDVNYMYTGLSLNTGCCQQERGDLQLDFGGRSQGKGQRTFFRLHTYNHLRSKPYQTD